MHPDPAANPAAGTLIADRYELIDRIAGGGMGDVWRATDIVLGRTVAIKFLRAEFADDQQYRERLRREARAAGSISHAGVVPVFDYGEIARDNAPYLAFIVMECVQGLSLSAELAERGPLGAERTLVIIEQTASALQAAHDAGIVHRDIKPGNILVTPQGDLKITDFGIARAADALPLTRTGVMTGTAKYLSPEQAGGQPATAASDIYSLGVVAYACLAGDVPFAEGNAVTIAVAHMREQPGELPTEVPEGLRDLVMAMLQKDPANRPATAGAVAGIARSLLLGLVPTAEGVDSLPRLPFAAVTEQTEPEQTELEQTVATDSTQATANGALQQASAADATRQMLSADGTRASFTSAVVPSHQRHLRLAAVATALAVLVALAIIWTMSGGTRVPSLVGLQRATAENSLAGSGLKSKVRMLDVAGKNAGEVIDQSAKPDSEIADGSTVTLTVATGSVVVPAGTLLGATYAEAVALLKKLGLDASRTLSESSKTAGTVLDVSPDSRAEIGSTIKLTVAVAPAPITNHNGPGNKKKGKGGNG